MTSIVTWFNIGYKKYLRGEVQFLTGGIARELLVDADLVEFQGRQ